VKRDTRFRAAIPVQKRLEVTLQFWATDDSYTRLQYIFQISKEIVSQTVIEVWQAIVEVLVEYIQVKLCFVQSKLFWGWNNETKYTTNKELLITELHFTQFKGTSEHSYSRLLNQQQKDWWERKSGTLVTGWEQDMKHQKSPDRQRIWRGLLCVVLYSWCVANNFATCLQWKCQNFATRRRLRRRLPLLTASV